MKLKNLTYLLLLLTFVLNSYGQNVEYGLIFNSKNIVKENRTSFSIPESTTFKLNKSIKLGFNFSFQDNKRIFGYITRIVLNDSINIDILSTQDVTNSCPVINIVSKGDLLHSFSDLKTDLRDFNNINLHLNPDKDSLLVNVNGVSESIHTEIPNKSDCQILFGINNSKNFYNTDVAPIIIKDLELSIDSKKPYLWKMDKHGNDFTRDENYGAEIEIKHGSWKLDKHTAWNTVWEYSTPNHMHTVFDDNHTLYIVTNEDIVSYDFITGKEKTFLNHGSFSSSLQSTSIVYDHKSNGLRYIYFNNNENSTSLYNFEKEKWNPRINEHNQSSYLHSNLIYYPKDSSIMQLFGYGFFRYKSSVFSYKDYVFDLSDISSKIPPRYLAAVGLKADTAYIFGGIGNKSGKQELGTKMFNDLYRYNIGSNDLTKVWDISNTTHTEIAAKNIIITPDKPNKGLALFFTPLYEKSYLVLKEIDLYKPEIITPITDTLEYNFHDINSEAQLFYVKELSKLFAVVTQKNTETGKYELSISSINYPVLQKNEILLIKQNANNNNTLTFIIIAITSFVFLFYLHDKKSNTLNLYFDS